MKQELLKPEHYDFLKNKYDELYNKKFEWADEKLLESMIKLHIEKVIEQIDENEYLDEIK
jgi:hypothetical protein